MRGAAQGTTRVESRYTIQTCDPSVSRTAVRWGPQFFFGRPAKIPRSFLRSFSLWARHPAETSAELNVRLGAAEFFLPAGRCDGEEAAEGRKCEGGAGNDSGRESVHDTNLRSVGEQNRCQVGPTILLRAPRQDPPLLPSIIFPLGPPSCGDECRAERALGCGRIFPCGQQAGATGEEAAEGRKCEGGAGNDSGRESVHDTNLRSVG